MPPTSDMDVTIALILSAFAMVVFIICCVAYGWLNPHKNRRRADAEAGEAHLQGLPPAYETCESIFWRRIVSIAGVSIHNSHRLWRQPDAISILSVESLLPTYDEVMANRWKK